MNRVQLKAFVVEDNSVFGDALVEALEELTCVKVVGSGATEEEGSTWLMEHALRWDVVIVDLFLRKGSGLGLVKSIGRRRNDQKIIVLSNYVTASVRMRCAQLGVDAVFDKSTDLDSLMDYCALQCSMQAISEETHWH